MDLRKHKKISLVIAIVLLFSVVLMAACNSGNTTEPSGGDTTPAPAPATDTGSAPAASDETYIMRIGCGAGGGNPQVKFMDEFKVVAEEMSGGRLTVELYPMGQLGTLAQMVQSVQDGSVSAYLMPTSYFSSVVPELEVLDIPSLFVDSAHITRTFMNNETSLTPKLRAGGIIDMAWVYLNDQIITGNKEIKTIGDFQGLKIWCNPGEAIQMNMQVLGMTTSMIDLGELTSGLQNGTLDMALAGAPLFVPYNLQDVAKYLILTPQSGTCAIFAVSQIWFDTMPADIQEIIEQASYEVNTNIIYDYGSVFQEECIQTLVDGGQTLIDPEGQLKADLDAAYATVPDLFLGSRPQYQATYDELKALAVANL